MIGWILLFISLGLILIDLYLIMDLWDERIGKKMRGYKNGIK